MNTITHAQHTFLTRLWWAMGQALPGECRPCINETTTWAGMLGTALTMKLRPVWKPVKPKRFAWTLGATLGACCLTFWILGMTAWIIGVLAICFLLTWLEAVMGFCVGCWMYSLLVKCEVCQLH